MDNFPFIRECVVSFEQEHRAEIDARSGTFQAFDMFGQQLLQSGHYASVEIQEKLESLAEARQELEKLVFSIVNQSRLKIPDLLCGVL